MNRDGTQRAIFGSVDKVGWYRPCGEFVILTSFERGSRTLKRLNLDGTHPLDLVRGNLWSPACSHSAAFIYYVNFEQPQKIWRVPIDGGSPVEVASILGDCITSSLTLSPDGTLLAYTYSSYSGVSTPADHLAVVHAADGRTASLFDIPGNTWSPGPYWTPSGRALQYALIHDQVSNIWEQAVAGGKARQLTHFNSGHIFDFTWSADGTRFFVTRGAVTSVAVLLTGLR